MTTMNANQARQALQKACKTYIRHSQDKLSKLIVWLLDYTDYQFDFMPMHGGFRKIHMPPKGFPKGFKSWMSCIYAFLFDEITLLVNDDHANFYSTHSNSGILIDRLDNTIRFESRYSSRNFPNEPQRSEISRLSYYLGQLQGLMRYILVDKNAVNNFDERWDTFLNANQIGDVVCLDGDSDAVAVFKKLTYLRAILQFTNTLSSEELPNKNDKLLTFLDNAIPTIERVAKQAAIIELNDILGNAEISDEEAVKQVTMRLTNPDIRNILEKNNQSKAEHIFKVLSVILLAVGIGIIPTVILASKRLYDSGGKSMNFFKPLSKQVEGDMDAILANTVTSTAV